MQVIPPGMDFSNVVNQEDNAEAADGDLTSVSNAEGSSPKAVPVIWSEVSYQICDAF